MNIFKISRNLVFLTYLLIFFITMLFDLTMRPNESLMENDIVAGAMGILMLLLGSHLLYFKKLWVNEIVTYYEKHLQGKPVWYQKWLSIHKNPKYSTIMTFIVGIGFAMMGLFTLFKSLF